MRKVFICLVLFSFAECRDFTLEPETSGRNIVDAVLQKLLRLPSFLPDYLFLKRIAYVESQYGTQDFTYLSGYHGGIWQVDEEFFQKSRAQISNSDGRYQRAKDIASQAEIDLTSVTWRDLRKPFYSGIFCAIHFYVALDVTETTQLPSVMQDQATIWQKIYRPSLSKSLFLKNANSLGESSKCRRSRPMDVSFLIDTSASLGFQNFRLALKFVVQLSSDFHALSEKMRIALLTYATKTKIQFPYTQYEDDDDSLKARILKTKYLRGNTYTGKAIQVAVDMMHRNRGDQSSQHSSAIQSLVLITDGKSSDEVHKANELAIRHGIKIYAIGVGEEIDLGTLLSIVDGDKSRVFQAINYSNLVSSVRDVMVERTCSTPTLIIVEDYKISLDETLSPTGSKDNYIENTYQIQSHENSVILITFVIQNDNGDKILCSNDPNSRVTIYSALDTSFVNSALYTNVHYVTFLCDVASTQCSPGQSTCEDGLSVKLRQPKKDAAASTSSPIVKFDCNNSDVNCDKLGGDDLATTSLSIISNVNYPLKMSVSATDMDDGDKKVISTTDVNSQGLRTTSEDQYVSFTSSSELYEDGGNGRIIESGDNRTTDFTEISSMSTTKESRSTGQDITATTEEATNRPDHVEDDKTTAIIVICAIAGVGAFTMAFYLAFRRWKKEKKKQNPEIDEGS